MLAVLTSEPSTSTAIAERAGLPGRERTMHATRVLTRLEADGLAVSETYRNWTWWRAAQRSDARGCERSVAGSGKARSQAV